MPEQESTGVPDTTQGEAAKQPIPPNWQIPRPTKSVEVNSMSYTDKEGTKHTIYLPKGTARIATKLLTENMYDELAKFPPYGEWASSVLEHRPWALVLSYWEHGPLTSL